MFARTFTFIAIIAATVIGVNAACDNGVAGYTHIVVSGDTCTAIAAQGGITYARLQSANPGINCNALYVGQRVCVPSN
ncbi:LysM-domain-containing protein [Armillaria gallica]|uniref:LysM-domain-containing protein n=1 Tax=Armillaria gallica TaxID=47427 RepID=A0A2H3CVV3_ARMGA|nr:LysM-domain-containing protein [Armillaria gallica]PBK85573.1 LysM-domain-containing protein [Armillaria gallica]PBK85584.1 LysM-domain-containing protein [Armillaria gallica]